MSVKTAELRVRVTSDTSSAAKSVEGVGSKVAGFATKAAKAGAAIGAALGAAVLWKGFQRLTAIDNATAKLKGLGYSAKQIDKIMANALTSVKGTSFGLGDAASAAASAVASGVKPGKDLTRTLSLIGDAATIAGTDFNSMGAIFNKVAASNKVQGDTLAQLADQGIPIIQLLSKELGVSASKVTELASKGKIDFATFQDAMEAGLGGAAQESGKTFTGALQNVQAAMGRIGAALLSGVFSKLPSMFAAIISVLDKLTPLAERAGAAIGSAFGKAANAVAKFIKGPLQALLASDLFAGLVGAARSFGSALVSAFRTAAPAIKTIVKALGPLIAGAAVGAIIALTTAFRLLGPAVKAAATVFAALVKAAGNPVFQALAIVLAGMFAPAIAQIAIFNAQMAFLIARTVAYNAVQKAAAIATKLWAAAQYVLDAAMNANPVGLIIIAIVALVAAIVVLWKRSQTFQKIVTAAFAAVKTAARAVGQAFVAIGRSAQRVWGAIKSGASAVAGALKSAFRAIQNAASSAWHSIRAGASTLLGWIRSAFRASFAAAAAVVRTYVGVIKTVISTIRTAIGFVIDKVGTLAAKFRSLTLPGSLRAALDAIKTAVDRVIDAVGNLISKLSHIPTPHINWPSPPKWFSKVFATRILPPVPNGGGRAAPVAPRVALGATRSASVSTGSGGITINVTGALDPEATARQIRRILEGHTRRVGLAT